MEILEEVEVKNSQNQINFDFLSEKSPKTVVQAENFDWISKETLVILIRAKGGLSPDFLVSGKSFMDWLGIATSGCKQVVIEEPKEENFLEKIKSLCNGFDYVAVFYSDTPLLKKSTFFDIMTYFSKRKMNVLKLLRGYVFRGEYLKNAKMLLSTSVEEFDRQDFTLINDAKSASFAFKVLNERILNFHKQNGVTMFGENTIFIDADVEIEAGTVIYPNNVLKGETYIGKNSILESGNFVIDSIINDEAYVCQSYIDNSKIGAGKTVGPFEKIIGRKI